jgi:hypothetical protein
LHDLAGTIETIRATVRFLFAAKGMETFPQNFRKTQKIA